MCPSARGGADRPRGPDGGPGRAAAPGDGPALHHRAQHTLPRRYACCHDTTDSYKSLLKTDKAAIRPIIWTMGSLLFPRGSRAVPVALLPRLC